MSCNEYDTVGGLKNWFQESYDKLFKFKKERSKITFNKQDIEYYPPAECHNRVFVLRLQYNI